MNRGEVWWINFKPSVGGEIKKERPAIIIISNDASNKFLNRVQVVPLTSKINKCYPSETFITLNGRQSKAMADQISTVGKERLSNFEGKVSQTDMSKIEKIVKLQLGLS